MRADTSYSQLCLKLIFCIVLPVYSTVCFTTSDLVRWPDGVRLVSSLPPCLLPAGGPCCPEATAFCREAWQRYFSLLGTGCDRKPVSVSPGEFYCGNCRVCVDMRFGLVEVLMGAYPFVAVIDRETDSSGCLWKLREAP